MKGLGLAASVSCFTMLTAYAQDKNIPKELYVAASIPDSLKEEANAVVRYSMDDVEVKGPGHSVEKFHTIVTILNEKANSEAVISLPYNRKFSTVSSFEMIIYDAAGKQLKKYHKGDMYEHAAEDNVTLVTDDRLMLIGHTIASYPTTVEMVYEIDNSSLIDIDTWHIQQLEQAVQHSYYHIAISQTAGFRYLNKNTTIKPQKSTINGMDNYAWEVSNLKGYKLEEGAEKWRVLPKIQFTSNAFEFYGVKGDFSSWQSFGNWIKALNADVCSLTPAREAEIRKMTDTIKTDKAKARFLYSYLQQNMRYVSIQLGIGGLKPFAATFVDQKKYGDCKALSNYMVALLKSVNIKAYYTIINAGANQEPAEDAFPSNRFNHIIVCVPFKGDTTWLECTSNTQPFGKLGSFTENRRGLLITEDGGRLVRTPRSTMDDNRFNSEVQIVLDADGGAKAKVKILGTGEYRSEYFGVESLKADEQKEFFQRVLNMKQPNFFEIKPSGDKDGVKELNMELEYDKFCDVAAGNKQFYRPKVFDLWGVTVPVLEKRKSDYYFESPVQKACVTTIDLPAGFEVETLPANQSLKFAYGTYEISYLYDAAKNQVTSKASFKLTNQVIPAAKYTEFQQYMDAVAKAQNKKLVIRHKA
ncbi:Transglutaminase-like enzyme, putative cysteine protease [Mucilaginibacter xinganensis]|uniref:Transglutaminase-like enzyme, putative cysteine protease n=1 Tax=Mucilaginibacter xinganensis TaxID=1234841 RepID=A0A223NRT3_9SPHI|nr:Transglutaminase-like enzyme, putative cysteine protease [Mucilaginibacter xinganensis]